MSNVIIIENNSMSLKNEIYIIPEGIKDKIIFAGFVYNGYISIYKITSRRKNNLYINKNNFFRYEYIKPVINYEIIDFIDLLKDIINTEKKIHLVKNESFLLRKSGVSSELIPVYVNYDNIKDDNFDYYIKAFRKQLCEDPNHPLYEIFERSFIKLLELKFKEAVNNRRNDVLNKVLEENIEFISKYNELIFYKAVYYYNTGNLYEAAEILFKTLDIIKKPRGEEVLLLTRILDELGKTSESLRIIEDQLLDVNDDLFILEYLRLLLKLEKISEMGEVIEKYQKMNVMSGDTKAYFLYYQGIFYMVSGKVNDALKKFESIRNTIVDDIYLRMNILQIYKLLNLNEEFEKEKHIILEKYNPDEKIIERINNLENDLNVEDKKNNSSDSKRNDKSEIPNEIKKAIEEAGKFTEDNPDNPWGFYSLGSLFLKIGDLEKAEENFIKSTDIIPENGIVLHGLGMIYSRRNDNEKAVEFFKKAIISKADGDINEIYVKWNYDTNLAYFSLADSYIRMKKIDEAIVVLKKGLDFDARSYMPHFQLGTCYEFRKEHFNALECYLNVKKLNSEFTLVDFYIGNCYMILKDYKNADKYMKSYIENDVEKLYYDYASEIIKKIADKIK
ncbi:MAG: hypothetical protein M0R46_02295 [Candidatus Muirbacterium halophilum]|nr:hypothetical protein [Candidatus Muirbacterium halophilum]MCK9474720.1 hypothetical protein [Candidatus Muirbacterium halophilum]